MLSDSVDRNGFPPFSTRLMRVKHVLVPSTFVVPCDNTDVIIYTQLIYENIIDERNVPELYLFNNHVNPVHRYYGSKTKNTMHMNFYQFKVVNTLNYIFPVSRISYLKQCAMTNRV